MARYYGHIRGNRGEATRMGTASSGINAHPRGWETGVEVYGGPVSEGVGEAWRQTQADEFQINVTGGSNGGRKSIELALVTEFEDRLIVTLGPAFGGTEFTVKRDGTVLGAEAAKVERVIAKLTAADNG